MVAVPNPAMIADATHAQIIRLCMIFCSGSNPAGPNASIRLAATTYTSKLVQICGQFLAKALIFLYTGGSHAPGGIYGHCHQMTYAAGNAVICGGYSNWGQTDIEVWHPIPRD